MARFNAADAVDGVLVQSPLPPGMGADAEQRVFDAIAPAKDVDGFNPVNVGRLVQNRPALAPGTPSGIIELLERNGIPIEGCRAVVIGRSDIVGKPMAALLLHRHATVTVCHSRTRDLPAVASEADILVAAIGRPGFVTADFVKPGATVIDVGTTRMTDRDRVAALFGPDSPRLEVLDRRGRDRGRGCAPGSHFGRRGADAGPGRGGAADHRDAAVEHRPRRGSGALSWRLSRGRSSRRGTNTVRAAEGG